MRLCTSMLRIHGLSHLQARERFGVHDLAPDDYLYRDIASRWFARTGVELQGLWAQEGSLGLPHI